MSFDGATSTVTVYGVAPDQATMEKIVLCCGNVAGVTKVNNMMSVDRSEPEATYYTVVSGDNLSKISKAQYGDAEQVHEDLRGQHADAEAPGQDLSGTGAAHSAAVDSRARCRHPTSSAVTPFPWTAGRLSATTLRCRGVADERSPGRDGPGPGDDDDDDDDAAAAGGGSGGNIDPDDDEGYDEDEDDDDDEEPLQVRAARATDSEPTLRCAAANRAIIIADAAICEFLTVARRMRHMPRQPDHRFLISRFILPQVRV